MKRILLIDADTLAYRAAAAHQFPTQWDRDLWTLHGEFEPARLQLDREVQELKDALSADEVIMALTDYTEPWRKKVLPTYKSNRKDSLKPILLKPLREYIHEAYETFQRPGLEGDDILGILMTRGENKAKEERICVSIDKDLKTIPGKHFNCDKPEQGVIEVTERQADRWHMMQTLTGDRVDGYEGCPGVGPVKAEKILADFSTKEWWPAVVTAYEKAGLSAEVALTMARVARICRATDYDFKKREVKLWNP